MDTERVLVPSEGHLDAATGFVGFRLLDETVGGALLEKEVMEYREMIEGNLTASTNCLDLRMALRMYHFFAAAQEKLARSLGEAARRAWLIAVSCFGQMGVVGDEVMLILIAVFLKITGGMGSWGILD
jgi:hypothetical protein